MAQPKRLMSSSSAWERQGDTGGSSLYSLSSEELSCARFPVEECWGVEAEVCGKKVIGDRWQQKTGGRQREEKGRRG